jgi:hypothetical protein
MRNRAMAAKPANIDEYLAEVDRKIVKARIAENAAAPKGAPSRRFR